MVFTFVKCTTYGKKRDVPCKSQHFWCSQYLVLRWDYVLGFSVEMTLMVFRGIWWTLGTLGESSHWLDMGQNHGTPGCSHPMAMTQLVQVLGRELTTLCYTIWGECAGCSSYTSNHCFPPPLPSRSIETSTSDPIISLSEKYSAKGFLARTTDP